MWSAAGMWRVMTKRTPEQHVRDILATLLTSSACFPILLVLQLQGSVLNALRAVLRREGIGGLYRGIGAVAWGAG